MRWRVGVREVRPADARGARWTLDAVAGGLRVTVYADVTRGGSVWSLQSDDVLGTSGYAELDAQIVAHIRRVLAHGEVIRQLDALEAVAR
jgi:hypothetical protein